MPASDNFACVVCGVASFASCSSACDIHTRDAGFKLTSANFACVVCGVAYLAAYPSA